MLCVSHVAAPGEPCASGAWPLAHLRWCLGTQAAPGVRQGVMWTERCLSASPDGAPGAPRPAARSAPEASACLESLALVLRPTPTSERPPQGPPEEACVRGKVAHAAAPPPPTRGYPRGRRHVPPRRNPHLTPRAAHLGHAGGKRATLRGPWRERDCDFTGEGGSQPASRTRR